MAEFCSQCSLKLFKEDYKDLAGIAKRGGVAIVICEGCGGTQVNSDGQCVSLHCERHGTENTLLSKQARR